MRLPKMRVGFVAAILAVSAAVAQARTEVNNAGLEGTSVGSVCEQDGYLLSRSNDGRRFLLVVSKGQRLYDVVEAVAEKPIVEDSILGCQVRVEVLVLKKEFIENENRIAVKVRIKRVLPDSAPQSGKNPAARKQVDLESFQGITLEAIRNLERVDQYRTLGMRRGFGQGQPVSDFKAAEGYVESFGTHIRKGERFEIGKVAFVPDNLDKGTKLLLVSGAPKAGLHFYCYGFDSQERRSWPIDIEEFETAVAGYFRVIRAESASQIHSVSNNVREE